MEKGEKLNEKERNVHGTTHDEKCRYDQNENQGRCSLFEQKHYSEKHKEESDMRVCLSYRDVGMESISTQRHINDNN